MLSGRKKLVTMQSKIIQVHDLKEYILEKR